ncbi:MAG: XTP/dITP diphosphatase [Candidatus Omnitrophica bacterium]|nr:XTP/dITP diphosphatase [Candidatus Omnitrophota bacterium]
MKEIIIATKNQGKLREIKELLGEFNIKVTSLADYPDAPDVVEDGKTFSSNAIKKAVTIGKYTGKLVMGEDSGLEIDVLDNQPGIYSARFAGDDATYQKNNEKVLKLLEDVPMAKRQARYRCFAALSDGGKVIGVVNGSCAGLIALSTRGENGFGYDPLFIVPRYKKTFGELNPDIKAAISHRFHALQKFKTMFIAYLSTGKKELGCGCPH